MIRGKDWAIIILLLACTLSLKKKLIYVGKICKIRCIIRSGWAPIRCLRKSLTRSTFFSSFAECFALIRLTFYSRRSGSPGWWLWAIRRRSRNWARAACVNSCIFQWAAWRLCCIIWDWSLACRAGLDRWKNCCQVWLTWKARTVGGEPISSHTNVCWVIIR
jgi:hypothetical protein